MDPEIISYSPLDEEQLVGYSTLSRSLPNLDSKNNSNDLSYHEGNIQPILNSRSQSSSRRPSSANLNSFASKYLESASKWAYNPLGTNKNKIKKDCDLYKIEYSVFQPVPQYPPIQHLSDMLLYQNSEDDQVAVEMENPDLSIEYLRNGHSMEAEFNEKLKDIVNTIDVIEPRRISQGSSGSYFVFGSTGEILGIFKPKDEEPYGPLSPKWTKWLHRTFFPCFFGRSCLIPNLGYFSEAAASVLDRQLLSNIVPFTDIVSLSSGSFYYGFWNKNKRPPKVGSLQLFLHNYVEAQAFFKMNPVPELSTMPQILEISIGLEEDESACKGKFQWNHKSLSQFREELEKLVILDYIMRNTDRGLDNWMIKIEWVEVQSKRNQKFKVMEPFLKIGAIDSGLAFPWKHPDEWRSFPYGWLFLPLSIIGQPFSESTRRHYLPLLTSTVWWEQTVVKLTRLAMRDLDYANRMWKKQLAVLKGQAFNVVEVLKFNHLGPLELTRRENVIVLDKPVTLTEVKENEAPVNDRTPLLSSVEDQNQMSGFDYNVNYTQVNTSTKVVYVERLVISNRKSPLFTWC